MLTNLQVRSLFPLTPADEPSRGSDSSANDSDLTHSPGSSGLTSHTAPGAAANAKAVAGGFPPNPTHRAINPSGVLRRLRRGSVRHSSSLSASDSASVSYQLPTSTREASLSQKSVEFDSSSSSTAPTVGITGLPELDPVLRFLQNQSTKVYREGFLLQLDDLDISGNSCIRRGWTHYFARLTGTVLSFWPANEGDERIAETTQSPAMYMNIADASLQIIDSLPANGASSPLKNILSISTAGRNRFLLHFSSVNNLTQWTAAIRLAIFEYALLQESYTGALIAGKGKYINGLRQVLGAPTKFAHGEWARVRFRPGTQWVRCWCVIEPPSEKETAKLRKSFKKQQRRSVYDTSNLEMPRASGCVVFYRDEKANKKSPIARIADAWMAYAVYPRGMELIDHSTLVKVHGMIEAPASADGTLQESLKGKGGIPLRIATEGSVFILPESRPAVTGYDILIRFLIPLYDAFSLYGRPTRLIADTSDTRSLMFALGCNRTATNGRSILSTSGQASSRGYLDILDVSPLIHTRGSQSWTEQEWMRNLKNLTAKKMSLQTTHRSVSNSRLTNTSATTKTPPLRPPPSLTVGFSEPDLPLRNTSKTPNANRMRLAPRQNTFHSIPETLSSPGASVAQGYTVVDGAGTTQNEHGMNHAVTIGHGPVGNSVNDGSSLQLSSSRRDGEGGGIVDNDRIRKSSIAGSMNSTANRRINKEPSIHSFGSTTTTATKTEEHFYTPSAEIAYQQSPLGRSSPVSQLHAAEYRSAPGNDNHALKALYSREERRYGDQRSSPAEYSVDLRSLTSDSYGQKDSDATLAPDDDYFSSSGGDGGKIGRDSELRTTDHVAVVNDGSNEKHDVVNTRLLPYEQSPPVSS
ncbi:hypothetical protein KEM54_000806 [Ascosphaera aggregata]|nr:hypothetical protein KEM54_000806 [Ascosphaera aggregata]